MDQSKLKAEYERQHSTEAAERVRNELQAKFSLILGRESPAEVVCLINEKTGEKFYSRKK